MDETPGEETIGERIRRLRLAQGLSQRELSGPGVSYAYVSRSEGNQRKPSLKAIRLLARRLDVDPGYIETGDPVGEAARRQLRLADAELELRLGQNEVRAEAKLEAMSTRRWPRATLPTGRRIERSACCGSASKRSPARKRPSASWSGTSRC